MVGCSLCESSPTGECILCRMKSRRDSYNSGFRRAMDGLADRTEGMSYESNFDVNNVLSLGYDKKSGSYETPGRGEYSGSSYLRCSPDSQSSQSNYSCVSSGDYSGGAN